MLSVIASAVILVVLILVLLAAIVPLAPAPEGWDKGISLLNTNTIPISYNLLRSHLSQLCHLYHLHEALVVFHRYVCVIS